MKNIAQRIMAVKIPPNGTTGIQCRGMPMLNSTSNKSLRQEVYNSPTTTGGYIPNVSIYRCVVLT